MNVPDPTIARGASLGPPPSVAYSGAPQESASLITRTPPPQHLGPAIQGGQRKRATGLLPAQPGSQHAMIRREAPKVRVDPKDVSRTRAELRRAKQAATARESAMIVASAAAGGVVGDDYKAALLAARDANDLVAALTRRLIEMESSSVSRPLTVTMARVREPAEVADEIANGDAFYVCLHDGCRNERWPDEAAMRRAHPTAAEMASKQAAHVFALLCEAPLDPLDPEGETIGYVAPVGSDGTTIARAAAKVEEESDRDAEMDDMRAKVTRLEALVADMAKGTGKK